MGSTRKWDTSMEGIFSVSFSLVLLLISVIAIDNKWLGYFLQEDGN